MGKYDREDDSIPSENGLCESGYFTPDAKNCFKCDNENVGMPGCSFAVFVKVMRMGFEFNAKNAIVVIF